MRTLLLLVTLALPSVALADSLPACEPGTHMVANPTPPGSMHHGGARCEPDATAPSAAPASPGAGAGCSVGHATTRTALGATLGIAVAIAVGRRRRR